MFFKKAICVVFACFSLSLSPSALKRDASSSSISDFAFVDSNGANDVTITDGARVTPLPAPTPEVQASAGPATPQARSATPNSLPDNSRLTPMSSPKGLTLEIPATSHQTAEVSIAATAGSTTSKSTPPICQSPSSTQPRSPAKQDFSRENFLVSPTENMSSSFSSSQPPQQTQLPQPVPVEPITPNTPSTMITPIVATALAANLVTHIMVVEGADAAPRAHPAQPTAQTQQTSSLKPIPSRTTNQYAAALSAMSRPILARQPCATIPCAAQEPMRLPTASCPPAEPTNSGDLSITIAPARPNNPQKEESDDAAYCCSFSCFGRIIKFPSFSSCKITK